MVSLYPSHWRRATYLGMHIPPVRYLDFPPHQYLCNNPANRGLYDWLEVSGASYGNSLQKVMVTRADELW